MIRRGSLPLFIVVELRRQYHYPADAYAVIAYYLANRQMVDAYINQQEAEAEVFTAGFSCVNRRLEEDPEYQTWRATLRERLLARNRKAA